MLAINLDRSAAHTLSIPKSSERFTLSSTSGLQASSIDLNGTPLKLGGDDEKLPGRKGVKMPAGTVKLEPASITFLAIADAGNSSCRLED